VAPFEADALPRILLKAPTGSGKSTGVPPMLVDAQAVEGMIVVVQPRRIAARMLARRVAQLMGAAIGGAVGYSVRFDTKMSSGTKVVFVTDGVLMRWLDENPKLDGIGAVIFDEFHERRLASDVALGRCLDLQEEQRRELLLVVMSATLEVAGLAGYLGECRQLEALGRAYPVEIQYKPHIGNQKNTRGAQRAVPVWQKCAAAVREAMEAPDCGNILVFLPGVFEIRKTVSEIEAGGWSRGWEICPLYSALPLEQQDRAVLPSAGPKVIVSTNVAETSLTIDGVRTVIDAGLARVSKYDAKRAMDTLFVQPIAQSSADQRAGRAGRVAAGNCVRLWSEAEQGRRAGFELPEVHRVDLTEVMLRLKVAGFEPEIFRWLDEPSEEGMGHALALLKQLGALDSDGELTETGRDMSRFSVHPRFARLVLAGRDFGCLSEAAFVAAAVQSESLFLRNESGRESYTYDDDTHDFAALWRGAQAAKQVQYDPRRCGNMGILARGARELMQGYQQIGHQLQRMGFGLTDPCFEGDRVQKALASAFSDQLAVRLNKGNFACRMAGGRRGTLDSKSAAKDSDIFIVTHLAEVEGKQVTVYFDQCASVSEELLRELFPEDLREQDGAVFDETTRRVVRRQSLVFRDLEIRSKDGGSPDPDAASALLAERVASGELKLKHWDAKVEQWIARLLGLREWMPELELPSFGEEDRALAIEAVCQGAVSYKEIKNKEVLPAVRGWLSQGQLAALDAYAPERIKLENGQTVKVHYDEGKPPWIALTVQRLFGVEETPCIAGGAMKLNVHICAPNQRPWQITNDLVGFWERGLEQMRKDLAGRYPKHRWEV